MEFYTFLRHLADSWGLLAMTVFFVSVIAWAFRPGSRATHDEIANSIFRNDTAPGGDLSPAAAPSRTSISEA